MSTLNQIAFILGEVTVTLYPAKPDGAPDLTAPVWAGACLEGLRIAESWLKVRTTPTGGRHPRQHPLVAAYQISLARVLAVETTDPAGFVPTPGHYVLDCVWVEEDTGHWHRRTFYGVTFSERDLESRDVDRGFSDGQTLEAERMVVKGGSGDVPALSEAPLYQVQYVGASGRVWLYDYNPATAGFTALASLTGRASIAYSGNALVIAFAGEDPSVETSASGLGATAFRQQMPFPDELPRLEFYAAADRVATVSLSGLWARSFADGSAGSGDYVLKYGATPVAALKAAGVTATQFQEL